jgi:hypothetical protein
MTRSRLLLGAMAASAVALSGCYVVPAVGPDGQAVYHHYPIPPAPVPGMAHSTMPVQLSARLYPANELANQTGMISGTVTNMRTGKGRFQLQYQNEMLVGEATRHGSDEKQGIASAYGSSGTYMQCEYRMNTPAQGAGTCTFSSGARYKLHIGS